MLRKCKIAEVLQSYSEYMKLNSSGKLNWRRWLKNKINYLGVCLKFVKLNVENKGKYKFKFPFFPGCCIERVLVDKNKVKHKDINAGVCWMKI